MFHMPRRGEARREMRKIIVFNPSASLRMVSVSNHLISLDGFFAGLNGEIDWHVVGDDIQG